MDFVGPEIGNITALPARIQQYLVWMGHVLAHVDACATSLRGPMVLVLNSWPETAVGLDWQHRNRAPGVVGAQHEVLRCGQVARPTAARRLRVDRGEGSTQWRDSVRVHGAVA